MTVEPSTDQKVQSRIFMGGNFTLNGQVPEVADKYRLGAHSLGLSVLLAQTIKAQGLGSVGVALTLLDRNPAWAMTAVGFRPEDASGRLVPGQGEGVFLNIEGVSAMDSWPSNVNRSTGTYRTFWLPPVGTLPVWKKLSSFFPKEDWKPEANGLASELFATHRAAIEAHWVPFMGA